jgi:hypothetical protein
VILSICMIISITIASKKLGKMIDNAKVCLDSRAVILMIQVTELLPCEREAGDEVIKFDDVLYAPSKSDCAACFLREVASSIFKVARPPV